MQVEKIEMIEKLQIRLTQNQFTIVDTKNYKWLSQYKWFAQWCEGTQSFYAVRNGKKKDGKQYIIYMHREILGLKRGDKRQADHINHNTLNNRKSNLRIVTNQQNQWNQKNPKGYSWHICMRKYQASIRVGDEIIHLGYFNTTKEAHNVYLEAKEKYHK